MMVQNTSNAKNPDDMTSDERLREIAQIILAHLQREKFSYDSGNNHQVPINPHNDVCDIKIPS